MSNPFTCPFCPKIFRWGRDDDSAAVAIKVGIGCADNAFWKLACHVNAVHPDMLMECPRRGESPHSVEGLRDFWRKDMTCGYCGSMSPAEFFKAVEAGCLVGPTDKSYKAYVTGPGHAHAKFYFQHLSIEDRAKFIDLYNSGVMKLGEPGHFYVRPFFVGTKPATS